MAADSETAVAEQETGYFEESRSLAFSVLSILPLVVLYHCGIVQADHPVRNLTEVWLEGPLGLVGLRAAHVLNVAVVLALVAVLWRAEKHETPGLMVVVLMIAEGIFYAMVLHRGSLLLADAVYEEAGRIFFFIGVESPAELMLALGAGVYEELVFRLLLVGGGTLLLREVFAWPEWLGLAVSLLVSSLLFSLVHHAGPMGEDFQAYTFLFRALCGALLGLIFIARGFGVAVWTHAVYNALVLVGH
ncbi:MAG: type II CAAX prenyl endopeptidase Rce1 family protein [Planctomycetota bacterium]